MPAIGDRTIARLESTLKFHCRPAYLNFSMAHMCANKPRRDESASWRRVAFLVFPQERDVPITQPREIVRDDTRGVFRGAVRAVDAPSFRVVRNR